MLAHGTRVLCEPARGFVYNEALAINVLPTLAGDVPAVQAPECSVWLKTKKAAGGGGED